MGDNKEQVEETTNPTPKEETNAPEAAPEQETQEKTEEPKDTPGKPEDTEAKETSEPSDDGDKEKGEEPTRKPRIERRFDKLTGKLKKTVEENQRLREQQQLKQQAQEPDPQQYQSSQGDERIRRLEETIMLDKVSNEFNAIQNQYSELNPDSPEYDPKLAETVTEAVEEEIFQKGNFEVRPTIDRMMRLVSTQSKKAAARANEAVAEDSKREGTPTGNTSGRTTGATTYDDIVKRYPIGSPEYKEAVARYVQNRQ